MSIDKSKGKYYNIFCKKIHIKEWIENGSEAR